MRSLVLVSVVLGVALGAPQGFPRDTAEVSAARAAFIAEYNRLAELAARAPDIHIYHSDPRQLEEHQTALHNALAPQTPVVPTGNPAFNAFSFSANLGDNQQFMPGPNTFPGQAGHMAGHQAGHQAGVQTVQQVAPQPTHRFAADTGIKKWPGPFAHTVPAGVNGFASQTVETPEVLAAKRAHFQAHAAALGFQG